MANGASVIYPSDAMCIFGPTVFTATLGKTTSFVCWLSWARITKIYFANTREDAQKIDFDDSLIYSEFKKNINKRKIPMIQMMRYEALKAFDLWDKKTDKVKY